MVWTWGSTAGISPLLAPHCLDDAGFAEFVIRHLCARIAQPANNSNRINKL